MDPRDVAVAAALGHQQPAGAKVRAQAREERVVVGDPVEGGGGEDRVDRPLEGQLGEVGDPGVDAVMERLGGPPVTIDYVRLNIDATA